MKKIMKIMTAATLFLCGLVFSGCGVKEIVKETINDSYKTWYKYEKKVTIPLGQDAEATGTTGEDHSLKDAELFVYFDPETGLKVAVQSTSSQDVQMLGGLVTQTVDVTIGGTKSYGISEFGKGKWAAVWASGKFEKSSEPKVSSEPEKCVILAGDDKRDFKIQWKKVLVNYLLNWAEQ